ncbi:tetratricopeptide repeat protein [Vibrio owensii]|uniref:tetratricopeptide repeat protein n=1 Tax=Vibrio owensii TaxID=696485 RepID=UPI003CC63543
MSLRILVAVSSALEIPMWRKVIGEVYGDSAELSDIHYVSNAARLMDNLSDNVTSPFDLLILSNDLEGAHGITLLDTLKLTGQIDMRTFVVVNTSLPISSFYSKDITQAPDLLIPHPINANLLREKLKVAKSHLSNYGSLRAQISAHEYNDAIEQIVSFKGRDTDCCWSYELLAYLFTVTGRPSKGIALLESLIKKNPTSDRLVLALVRLLVSQNEYDKLISLLDRKERRGENLLCYFYCLAMCFESKGDLSRAAYYLERAEALNFVLPEQKLFASLVQEKTGELEKAVKSQLKAIDLGAGTHIQQVKHYNRLSDIASKYWNESGDEPRCEYVLNQVSSTLSKGSKLFGSEALQLHSELFQAHIYQLKGDQESLDELLTDLLTNKPDMLAIMPGALNEVLTILNLSCPDQTVYSILGTNVCLDRVKSSVKQDHAMQLNKMLSRANEFFEEGDLDEAERLLMRVVTNAPKHVPANVGLMRIYANLYQNSHNVTYLESAYRFMEAIHPVDPRHIMYKKYGDIRSLIQEHVMTQV